MIFSKIKNFFIDFYYKIKKSDRRRVFITLLLILLVLVCNISYFRTFSDPIIDFNTDAEFMDSGIYNDSVLVNTIVEDYNYYMGLNYTYNTNGTLPTTANKNIYNDNNLVQMKITYSSIDSRNNTGYVSNTERQNRYVYFGTHIVNDNGTPTNYNDDYVDLILIDNPFTDRPTDAGFNGWYTTDNSIDMTIDLDYYERHARIPIAYVNGKPESKEVTFHASWSSANVVTANGSLNGILNNLETFGLKPLKDRINVYGEPQIAGLFLRVLIPRNQSYAGYYNNRGVLQTGNNRICRTIGGCTYYSLITDEEYDAGEDYYDVVNGYMAVIGHDEIERPIISSEPNEFYSGLNMAGFYKLVNVPRNSSVNGYYNQNAVMQSGTCTNATGCDYYELLKYYDNNNTENVFDSNNSYFHLITRDLNIVYITGDVSGNIPNNTNYPLTLTSLHNGVKRNVTWNANAGINFYDDATIENITMYYNSLTRNNTPTGTTTSAGNIFAHYTNLRIGRGMTRNGNYYTVRSVTGGSGGVGSSGNPRRYKLMVESGFYDSMSLSSNGTGTTYILNKTQYGNDYDRANGDDSKMDIYYCSSGSWNGTIYADVSGTNSDNRSFELTVKSGNYGSGRYDYTTGIYVGGRSGGTQNAVRQIKIEGGHVYNVIGGPISSTSRGSKNDIYIYMTGGEVDGIFGGAGTSATYGNRIISVTGGTVNYSIFGGSNGYQGATTDGTIRGSSFIYVGGNAVVGNDTYISNNSQLWGAESGSVFGIGNGRNTSSSIGSNDNSNVIIDGNATIKRNVYGGGNYGATGVNSSASTTTTNIVMNGGHVIGSIYGGGNRNGSGSTTKTSTINITMNDGEVGGSIYGGSNILGRIYGSTNVNVLGGIVSESVYGGGQGGYDSSTNYGTFVRDNVEVTIGSSTPNEPVITGSVYGGSAFGSVNGENNTGNVSTRTTNVTVNNGIIGNVFGGGQGNNQYTPYVMGSVTVDIYNGDIGNVFGGNDQAGVPNGNIVVNVRNGTVDNVFGGGNQTGANITTVNFSGGEAGNIYGGSNLSGNVTNTSVHATGGTADFIYGGNNLGGSNSTTSVVVDNGNIGSIFGGGNQTGASTTNVTFNGGNAENIFGGSNLLGDVTTSTVRTTNGTAGSVYGGNNQGGTTNTTNVTIDGGDIGIVYGGGERTSVNNRTNVTINASCDLIFGGSNLSGNIPASYVTVNSGTIDEIYGGNNQGGKTTTTNVTLNNANINSVFGGGLKASTDTTNVTINSGSANYIYGGGNEAGAITTNVKLGDSTVGTVFGGSNVTGDVTNSYISNTTNGSSNNSNYGNIYGGNNQGGQTTTTNINLIRGNIDNIYGGGNMAITDSSNIDVSNVHINESIFGGGNEARVLTSDVNISSSVIGSNASNAYVYGGGNKASADNSISLTIDSESTVYGNIYGGANLGETGGTIEAIINNTNVTGDIFGGGNQADVNNDITLNISNNSHINGNVYSGGNLGDTIGFVETTISNSTIDNNIYGGGNAAPIGINANTDANIITLNNVTANNFYGGGNASYVNGNAVTEIRNSTFTGAVYAGGNGLNSAVEGDLTGEQNYAKVLGNTNLYMEGSSASNIYGGGNLGMVNGNTNVVSVQNDISDSEYGGGNAAVVNGNTYINVNGGSCGDSLYAAGNGALAKVKGSAVIDVHNGVVVENHVFGGGNAAQTGSNENNDSATVNIVGAHIGGNVYGGPNTSTVNGSATVNIGKNAVNNNNLTISDIFIGGTVFGGGEANAAGSEVYDFSFISVTKGINILIDGSDHDLFDIEGSIFGSGNASSSAGGSYITLKNYGTVDNVQRNISLQRANEVILDNSYVQFIGAKDRTNEYSEVLFSVSRIDDLKLINSSSIFFKKGANLLKKMESLAYENGNIVKGYATIDTETGTITKNVNNRVYMLEGENLNIATDQFVTEYGDITGMFFFGMYLEDRNKNVITALYSSYDYGEEVPGGELYFFSQGSYVLGKHFTDHDITVDGFYSNYASEDGAHVINRYIEPTPPSAQFYIWSVGEVVASYDVALTASKYSTLGIQEVPLINHANPNTVFSILGVNCTGLNENIELIDYTDIPRVASSEEIANSIFGIGMKSGATGWLVDGSTKFVSSGSNNVLGTLMYERENVNNTPSFAFYLYHSKNVTYVGSLGSVTVSLAAITTIDGLNKNIERININIDLYSALYDTNDYEGTITPGKKYELFGNSPVRITSKSSFSTYYSLYAELETSPYKTGYHRSIVSTYALPVNTKITMIDLHDKANPIYFYYVVNETDHNSFTSEYNQYGECSVDLSKFIKMGSTSQNNNYDDAYYNSIYYHDGVAEEEFIFIVDFKDSNITTNVEDKSILIELRNADDHTLISVLGLEQDLLKYSVYANSDAYIELSSTVSKDPLYLGDSDVLTIDTDFVLAETNGLKISDTTLEDEKLGIKISIYDSHNNLLTAQDLLGANFTFNDTTYYPRYDGTTRIKIADKIGSARSWVIFNTGTSRLSTDDYRFVIESFGSYDGTYYGSNAPHETDIDLKIISTLYGLQVTIGDEMLFIDKETGFNTNGNNKFNISVKFVSELTDPSVKIKLQRRKYDNVYDTEFYDVDFKDYFDVNYNSSGRELEYDFVDGLDADSIRNLTLKDNLISGTYRLLFNLYDGDTLIGDVCKYIIIK